MTDKIFACEECGQVYHTSHPEQCMRISISLFGKITECYSTDFKEIKEEDVLDIHDLPKFLFDTFIKKLF